MFCTIIITSLIFTPNTSASDHGKQNQNPVTIDLTYGKMHPPTPQIEIDYYKDCRKMQANTINRGVTQQGFGTAIIFSGVTTIISGAVYALYGVSSSNHSDVKNRYLKGGGITAGIGAAFAALGGYIFSAGRDNVYNGFTMTKCTFHIKPEK